MTRFFVLLGYLLAAILAGDAFAHAVLIESHPADRTTLASSPDAITLRFNEPVNPIGLRLTDRDGLARALADPITHDSEIHLRPAEDLPPGFYILSYRVTSVDSHPVSGSLVFAIGLDPANWDEPTPVMESAAWSWTTAAWRSAYLTALVITVGATFFSLIVHRGDAPGWTGLQPWLTGGAIAGAALAASQIGMHGASLDGTSWAGLLSLDTWAIGWNSARGKAAVVAAAGFAIIAAGSRIGLQAGGRTLLAIGGAGVLLSFTLSGHMATSAARMLAIVIHAAAAAFWIGSLLPLLLILRNGPTYAATTVSMFSRVAVPAVAALVLAGLLMAVLQIPAPAQLITTGYGRLLTVKSVLAGLLVAIAAYNKLVLTPRLCRGDATAARRLAATIHTELVLGIAILGLTALLTQTPPPQTAAPEAPDTRPRREETVAITARGKWAFVTRGANGQDRGLLLRFAESDGRSFAPLEVTLAWSDPARGVEPILRRAETSGDGIYRYDGPELGIPGLWTLRIDALVSDFERVSFSVEMPVH